MAITHVASSFLLGIEPVPSWARRNRKIVFVFSGSAGQEAELPRKALVETEQGGVLARAGDRIVLTREGALKVFPRGPLEAA